MKFWIVFYLEQISLNVAEHNVGWLSMVIKRSNISLSKDVQWMLGELLNRLIRALCFSYFKSPSFVKFYTDSAIISKLHYMAACSFLQSPQ